MWPCVSACVHNICVRKGARNYLPLLKHEWHIWKLRPWQPARHFLQMTVRVWFGRNLDHRGTGGGVQDAGGARVGVLVQPGLEGADPGRRSSGEDGGECPRPGHPRRDDRFAVVL